MQLDNIINLICSYKGVNPQRIFTSDRHQNVIFARFTIWHYLHYHVGLSATQIGRIFNRTRPIIFRGIRMIKHQFKYHKELCDEYHTIVIKLEGMDKATPSENVEDKD